MQLLLVLSQADVIAALQAYAASQNHEMDATTAPVVNTTNNTVTIQLNK